jgi:polar amino acid transport system substrate-binding protein
MFSDPYYKCNSCSFTLKKNLMGGGGAGGNAKTAGVWRDLVKSFKQNFIDEKRYLMIIDGFLCTMKICLLSALFATLFGAIICYMRMRKKNRYPRIFAKAYILFFRAIPQVVLLMILFYAVLAPTGAGGVTVSVVGFALVSAAYVAEMMRSALDSVGKGQRDAGLSMGFTPFQTFVYIISPLAIRRMLPVYKGELIGLVKATSIVGYITVQDLTKVSDIIRSMTFDSFMPLLFITVIYFLIIWIFSMLLNLINVKYTPKENRFV